MSKYCKKCEKEIPKNRKKNLCDNCQNKTNRPIRKFGEWAVVIVTVVGTTVLSAIIKDKLGGPKL